MKRTIPHFAACFFLIFSTLFSQEYAGKLEGRILDQEGIPIILADISISSQSMQGIRKTITNKQGYFYAFSIPVGNYTIKISHISKQNITFENIIIRLGKTTSLGEVILKEEVSEIQEVVVSSGKPIVDVGSTQTGLSLEQKVFENLPIQRDYKSVLSLSPLASESYYGDGVNVSGSTGWENSYFIDGTNVTDPMRGSSGTNLPYNFIKEVEIKNGGYQAEYGKALGAIVNVITHQGGNKFHGQVFGFFTDQSFAGEYKTGTVIKRIKDFATYDVGMSFGGPIIYDKLWYFVAYNPTFEDLDVEIPDVGVYKDRTRSHLFAGKLTWQPIPKTNLILTLIGDPTTQERVENQLALALPPIQSAENADPFLGDIKTGGYNMSLKVLHIFNNNFFMEVFLSGLSTYYNDFGSTEYGRIEPFYMDFVNDYIAVSGGYGRSRENHSRRLTALVNVTYTLSSHIIKAGIGYEDNFVDNRTINMGGVNGDYPNPIMYYKESFWIGWWAEKDVRVHNKVPSIFLQDSWLATKRLRINTGIRWDGQFLIGSDGKIAQKIINQWQPRFGLTYQPGELGNQKIYSSYGRFYEQLPLIFISTYAADDISQQFGYTHDPRINPEGGFLLSTSSGIQPKVTDLQGQYYDEFILGYERRIGDNYKIGIQGVYRNLGDVVEDGEKDDGNKIMGNPGRGELNFLPKFTRKYTALEITFQKTRGRFNFLASYILSKNYGNYPGVFDSDIIYSEANLGNLDKPIQLVNATGLLPNDRTHLFKVFGSYNFDFGLTVGTSFILQSGTPINEFGPVPPSGGADITFHTKRGSAGRTPTIWDLNIRLSYDLGNLTKMFNRFRILIDMFHLFSQQEAVLLDQRKYFSDDGEGNRLESPNYLDPIVYQSPMTVRLGVEVNF